jgi:hypothetical protein
VIDKVKARMNALADEAEKLYQRKMDIENESNQIDARISQIVGAMQELDKLQKELQPEEPKDVVETT